jgi:hypothetical protein
MSKTLEIFFQYASKDLKDVKKYKEEKQKKEKKSKNIFRYMPQPIST